MCSWWNRTVSIKIWTAMAQNPVMPLTDAEAVQILDDFRHVQHRFHQVGHAYYADMVSRSVKMMVLDMYHIHALQYSDDLKGVDQSAWIMRRFIDLLQQGLIRQHRTVEYYASRLNITPNYLTECCIKTSRHNASFFIEHFTAEEIARLLKRQDLFDYGCSLSAGFQHHQLLHPLREARSWHDSQPV